MSPIILFYGGENGECIYVNDQRNNNQTETTY